MTDISRVEELPIFRRHDVSVTKYDAARISLNYECFIIFHPEDAFKRWGAAEEDVFKYCLMFPHIMQLTRNTMDLHRTMYDKLLTTHVLYAMEKLRVFEDLDIRF